MKTKTLIAMIIALALVSALYCQAENKQKNFSLKLDVNTGDLNPNGSYSGLFDKNYFATTFEWKHEFESVTWLSLSSSICVKSTINSNYYNAKAVDKADYENGNFRVYPDNKLNGVKDVDFGLDEITVTLGFSKYASLTVNQRLLISALGKYPVELPASLTITPSVGLSFYPYLTGTLYTVPPIANAANKSTDGVKTDAILQNLFAGFSIESKFDWTNIPVLKDSSIAFDAFYLTNGKRIQNRTPTIYHDYDTKGALLYNSFLRFNLTYNLKATKNFSTYLQARYEIQNIIQKPPMYTREDRVANDVFVLAGLTYSF